MNTPDSTFDLAAISAELKRIAEFDPRSLPAKIEPNKFDEVAELVAQNQTPGCDDIEIATIASLARVRDRFPQNFRKKKLRQMRY